MLKNLFGPAVVAALLAGTWSTPTTATEAIGVLNDTGQTSCYGIDWNAVPCDEGTTGDNSPLPRQDGRYGRDAGAAMGRLQKVGGGEAGFDYTRICMSGDEEGQGDCPSPPPLPADLENPQPNDWACLRDNVTGLTWTLGDWAIDVNWATASSTADGSQIQHTNAIARCGLSSGWRLPARREAWSLFDLQRVFPAVDPGYFPVLANSPSPLNGVWTADPVAWHAEFQWAVSFGQSAGLYATQCRELNPAAPPCDEYPGDLTDFTLGVLLVNGAWKQPSPSEPPEGGHQKKGERWQIRNDGLTVTDAATGLTWDRCSWRQVDPTCVGQPTIFSDWTDAMQVARIANEQRYLGFHDWRLPNASELETLVKIDGTPAINTNVFPNTLLADNHSYYATSSQLAPVPGISNAYWCVEFVLGTISTADKVNKNTANYPNIGAVRLVRGGLGWDPFDGVSDRLFWEDFDGPSTTPTVH